MSAESWLVVVALGVFALWVVAGLIEAAAGRQPVARIVQSPRPPMRPYPEPSGEAPWHPEFNLARGRRVRAARCRHHWED